MFSSNLWLGAWDTKTNKGQVPHEGHEDLALTMTETWASVNTAMRRERGGTVEGDREPRNAFEPGRNLRIPTNLFRN